VASAIHDLSLYVLAFHSTAERNKEHALPMNADLEHLIVLQAQDLELKRLRAELDEAPKRVLAAQTARARAEVALAEATHSLAKEETLRRSQELDVKDRQGKIARLQKQMEGATSAAQITALEHEIDFARQTIGRLEDEELASMERTESFEAAKSAAAELLETTTAALAAARANAADLAVRHTASIAGIEAERAALRPQIAEGPLSLYDRIAKAKGTGLSEAVDHKCTACQMMVRPQRWNDLTGREHDATIFTCETCGRMLFYDPRRDAPVRWTPGERLSGPKPTASVSEKTRLAESA
jgi:predicted  nucleic acid-binding Zn-ribbon protein